MVALYLGPLLLSNYEATDPVVRSVVAGCCVFCLQILVMLFARTSRFSYFNREGEYMKGDIVLPAPSLFWICTCCTSTKL